MSLHVIVGRGGTARRTAELLAAAGDRVRLVSRSGAGPGHPNIETVALDALDTGGLTDLAKGAATVLNCAMPAYHTWPAAVPPLFGSVLAAAERAGANYVMLSNLYAYGPVDGPVTEDTPLTATGPKGAVRARMWREAKAAHDAGQLRVTEVRAGQFLGAGAVSLFTLLVLPKVVAGQLALVPAAPDQPHSFAYLGDVARTLVAVLRDDRSWGRPWLTPSITGTVRELAGLAAAQAGAPEPRLAELTDREVALLGLTDPFWNELPETRYMETGRFLADPSHTERTFGLAATPVDEVVEDMLGA
jgi:nucleoside-diphosphate-sugar epimerase